MDKYLIQDTTLTEMADKIRILSGSEETMAPAAMGNQLDSANSEVDTQAGLLVQILDLLPNADSWTLPELANPAGAEQIKKGYQAIDEEGEIVNGSYELPALTNPATAAQILTGYDAVNNAGEVVTGSYVPITISPTVQYKSQGTASSAYGGTNITVEVSSSNDMYLICAFNADDDGSLSSCGVYFINKGVGSWIYSSTNPARPFNSITLNGSQLTINANDFLAPTARFFVISL